MGMHSILCVCPSVSRIPPLMCCWKTAAVFEIIMMSHYKNNTCQYFIIFVCLAPSLSESQLKHNKSCCDKKTRCITFIFHVNWEQSQKIMWLNWAAVTVPLSSRVHCVEERGGTEDLHSETNTFPSHWILSSLITWTWTFKRHLDTETKQHSHTQSNLSCLNGNITE